MRAITIKTLIFLILSFNAFAKDYDWKVVGVVDGDTLKVEMPYLPEELKVSVRVLGIDTPEKGSKAKCSEENKLALKATKITTNLVNISKKITFSNIKWDKYGGRILADVMIDGDKLSDILIRTKVARPYFGDKKQSWCN